MTSELRTALALRRRLARHDAAEGHATAVLSGDLAPWLALARKVERGEASRPGLEFYLPDGPIG